MYLDTRLKDAMPAYCVTMFLWKDTVYLLRATIYQTGTETPKCFPDKPRNNVTRLCGCINFMAMLC